MIPFNQEHQKQVEKNHNRIVSHLDTQGESKKHPDETYFPPQKIFVVITRLERLKKKEMKGHLLQKKAYTTVMHSY